MNFIQIVSWSLLLLLLIGLGAAYRSKRCWAFLFLTALAMPAASFLSTLFSGYVNAHPPGDLFLESLLFPYTVFALHLVAPTEDRSAGIIIGTVPIFQALFYGVGCAIGAHKRKLLLWVVIILIIHVSVFLAVKNIQVNI